MKETLFMLLLSAISACLLSKRSLVSAFSINSQICRRPLLISAPSTTVQQTSKWGLATKAPVQRHTPILRSSTLLDVPQNDTKIEHSPSDNNEEENIATQYKDLYDFNQKLNNLAEECADRRKQVVSKAAACQQLWKDCVSSNTSSSSKWQPDVISFNSVLKAWSRCCQTLAEHKKEHEHMLDANVPVYTARDAAERALHLLNRQEMECSEGVSSSKPDAASFNIVMDAWAKSRAPEATDQVEALLKRMQDADDTSVQPDSLSYNALVDAYAYSDRPDRIQKLTQLWKQMDQLSKSQDSSVRVTVRVINSILHAYSKATAEAEDREVVAQEAADILKQLKERYAESKDPADQPDVMTYTTVMDVYSRVGSPKAARQAEQLCSELKNLYQQTGNVRFQPSIYTYVTLITAWARSNSPQAPWRSDEILEEMLADDKVVPSSRAFTAVIQSWARSRESDKATRALKYLQRMKELAKTNPEVAPTIVTYNAAIDCCGRTRGNSVQQTAALKIAFAVLKAIQKDPSMEPTYITFGNLLKCVEFLLPAGEERNTIAKAVFQKAIDAGQVEFSVIKNLQKASDASLLHELLEQMEDTYGHIDYNRIPATWSKHVR